MKQLSVFEKNQNFFVYMKMAALTFPHCCIKTLLYDCKDETLVYITKTGNRQVSQKMPYKHNQLKGIKKNFSK